MISKGEGYADRSHHQVHRGVSLPRYEQVNVPKDNQK